MKIVCSIYTFVCVCFNNDIIIMFSQDMHNTTVHRYNKRTKFIYLACH